MDQLSLDFFTTTSAYTPHVYRDQYPSINPTSATLSQASKVILITGASAGIGARGFAPTFAKAAPKAIVLVGRDVTKLKAIEVSIKSINQEVDTIVCSTEVTDEPSLSALFSKIKSSFGYVDVFVNNAVVFSTQGFLNAVNHSKWWLDFKINVQGAYLVTQAFLSLLGTESKGTIINMSTNIATAVMPGLSSYSISKLAIIRLSEYIAAE
jgi:NADP-dependent 3-hydroxy acid dehydrogenase YdfG